MEEPKKILIVEDDPPLRNALREKLSDAGLRILEAKNGEEGLSLALSEHPALILLDILMPKMDGMEMLKKVRADELGKRIPVIILTNLSENGEVAQAMEHEVFDYFIKSDIKIEEVVEKVRERLGV